MNKWFAAFLAGGCMWLVACPVLSAQTSPALDPALGITTIPLYDTASPTISQAVKGEAGKDGVGKATAGDDQPTLTVFLPHPGRGNGTAIIVAPGGAYLGLASNLEGRQVADWFTVRGFTAFVLKYRKGPRNLFPIPLMDGQRAIRLVRSLCVRYAYASDRVGIIGFSAGGHLAASTATLFDQQFLPPTDAVDHLSARPDFVVLGYPWLNAMEPAMAKEITYCSVTTGVTTEQCNAFETAYTPKLHVTSRTPTTFIYATTDDRTVPVRASVDFYEAMVKAGAPVEMHLFAHGAHGSGLGNGEAALDLWPVLLEQWLRDQGLLTLPADMTAGH